MLCKYRGTFVVVHHCNCRWFRKTWKDLLGMNARAILSSTIARDNLLSSMWAVEIEDENRGSNGSEGSAWKWRRHSMKLTQFLISHRIGHLLVQSITNPHRYCHLHYTGCGSFYCQEMHQVKVCGLLEMNLCITLYHLRMLYSLSPGWFYFFLFCFE